MDSKAHCDLFAVSIIIAYVSLAPKVAADFVDNNATTRGMRSHDTTHEFIHQGPVFIHPKLHEYQNLGDSHLL